MMTYDLDTRYPGVDDRVLLQGRTDHMAWGLGYGSVGTEKWIGGFSSFLSLCWSDNVVVEGGPRHRGGGETWGKWVTVWGVYLK